MQIAILSFFAVFMLIAGAGLLVTYLRNLPEQVPDEVGSPDSKKRFNLRTTLQDAGRRFGVVVGKFEGVLPKSQAETSVLRQRLIRAGYRGDTAVKMFYGGQFVLMVGMAILVVVTGLAKSNYLLVIVASVGFGFLAPGIWLGRKIASRQKQINRYLPDLIDLLIICVEAGLSLDDGTYRRGTQ